MVIVGALVAVSLFLVIAGLVFFASRLRDGDFEHADRLSLLPLDDDENVRGDADGGSDVVEQEGEAVNGNR